MQYSRVDRLPVALLDVHGYEEVILHAAFASAGEAGAFIEDYALNTNISVKFTKNCGSFKRWGCSAAGCGWFVSISEKRIRENTKSTCKRPVSNLSHISDGSWYVSKFNLQHAQCCCSRANPTGEQLNDFLALGQQC